MGSRFGSIAVLIIIAAIIGIAGVIIYRLGLLDADADNAPPIVVSIEDGALLLLGEPQNITVSVASGAPITSLRLVVDENLLAEAIPVYSADRGAYIGSIVWTPQRLGFADLNVIVVDEQGRESVRSLRVEVTDDPDRIAAALQLQVGGLAPNQQLIAGSTVRIALRASGAQAIDQFEMVVDGELAVAVEPTLGNDGAYVASIDWTPLQLGAVEVEFRVIDAGGRTETLNVQVTVLERGAVPGAASGEASSESQRSEDGSTATASTSAGSGDTSAASGDAAVLIVNPVDGEDFRLTPNLAIDIELLTRNTGPLASVLLYVTAIAEDGSSGDSILIFSAADSLPPSGEYREVVSGFERWLTSAGRYELQLVVFAADERRFDHRIIITAIADGSERVEDDEEVDAPEAEEEGEADPEETDAEQPDIDLALINARQPEQDRGRLNIALANLSAAPVERAQVRISLIDSHDGAVLNEARVTLSLAPDEIASIPLDFSIRRDVSALLVLESNIDSDTSNNTLQVALRAPALEVDEAQTEQEQEQAEQTEEEPQEATPAEAEPEGEAEQQPLPDLAFHEVVFNHDGFALITVINQGDADADQVVIALLSASGAEIERIARAPNAQPLPPGGAEILVSSMPHDEPLTLVLDPDAEVAEADETNNRVTADPTQ